MKSRKPLGYFRYATSDPFRSVDVQIVRSAYKETLQREQTDQSLRQLRAGQLASELAVHSALSSHDSLRWLDVAGRHFTSVAISDNHDLLRGLSMAYLPQLGAFPAAERLKRERLLQCFARGFNRLIDNVNDDGLFGQVNEVAAHIAVASLVRHGLTARTAFIREESNLRRSPDGLRNRDMTVFSDGSTVPAGTYAVQLKTSHPIKDSDSYDPRIVTLYGEDMHGHGDNSVRTLVRSVHAMTQHCLQPDGDITFTPTDRVVATILPALEQTGPYTV